MFCEKCGSKIPDGSAFCPNCGAKAAAAAVKEAKKEAEKAAEVVKAEAAAAEQQAAAVPRQAAAVSEAGEAQAVAAAGEVQAAAVEAQAAAQEAVPAAVKPPKQKKEKSGKGISPVKIALIAVLAVVLVVAAIFVFSKGARNAVKKAFSSDESYFKSVELAAIDDLAGMLATAYDDDILELADLYKSTFSLTGDLDVTSDAEALLSIISKASNKKVDLDWLKSGKIEAEFSMNDATFRLDGALTANKKTLFDFDAIVDINDGMAYLGLPLLHKEYAGIDISDKLATDELLDKLDTFKSASEKFPKGKDLKKLVLKYAEIALDNIKKVNNVKKDVKLSVGSAKGEYTRYRVIFDDDLIKDILYSICDTALDDKELEDILLSLSDAGLIREEDIDRFYDGLNNTFDNIEKLSFDELTLEVYVDGSGDIVAQHIFNANSELTAAYQYAIGDDNSFGFEIGEYRNDELRKGYSIDGTISGSTLTGKANYVRSGSVRNTIEFSDVNIRKFLSGNPVGKLEYNLSTLMGNSMMRGVDVVIDFDLKVKNSKVTVTLKQDDKKLIELDASLKKSSSSSIKAPKNVFDIEDNNDIKDYLEDLDWDNMIENWEAADMPDSYVRILDQLSRKGLGIDDLGGLLPGKLRRSLIQ